MGVFGEFNGLKLFSADLMYITTEDWSEVRSPGRARRRRKRGHRQNIRFVRTPDPKVIIDKRNGSIIGHPVTLYRLVQAANAEPRP